MKFFLKGMIVILAFLSAAIMANASPILQTEFSTNAIVYDFSNAATNDTTISDGLLTVSNGIVLNFHPSPNMLSPTYFDGNDTSIIRFDFSKGISAVGASFYANNSDITLSLFNNSDVLIESHTIDWNTLPTYMGYPYGFIGINVGSPLIAYALIDTPLSGNELFIDNITYQTTPTPIPAAIWIFSSGIAGLAGLRRRKKNTV